MNRVINWDELPVTLTPKDLYTKVLPIGMNSAYELCNRKDFPAVRVGKKIIIPRDALRRWLEGAGA